MEANLIGGAAPLAALLLVALALVFALAADFVYPTSEELMQVAQDKIPVLTQDDPLFEVMPITNTDHHLLVWEQMDNFLGLQQVRGLDGAPGRVARTGGKSYRMEPGAYGEFSTVKELELTERRKWGTFGTPIDISDLVMLEQDRLLQRRLDRIRYIGWTLLTTGTFSVSGPNGILHTDSFTLQTYNASTWGTAATATPLADFRAVQLLSRGHSVSFGPEAQAFMNRVTANRLLANTNDADIYGKRTAGLANLLSVGEMNVLLAKEGLPQIAIYDGGYLNDGGTFVPWLADNVVCVAGKRPAGQAIGEYRMTRNANNPNMAPGPYMRVIDRGSEEGGNNIPRTIEVHDGHNGGPVVYFGSAIVIMDVS